MTARRVRIALDVGADLVVLRLGRERIEVSAAVARQLARDIAAAADQAERDRIGMAVLRGYPSPGGQS